MRRRDSRRLVRFVGAMNSSTEPTDDPPNMGKAKDAAAKDTVVAAAAHVATAHATNADAEALAHGGEGGFQDDPARAWMVLTAASAEMDTVATADGLYRYVSPASQRLFGWDPFEVQGHHRDEYIHPDDLPVLRAHRASIPASGVFTMAFRFRCADGSYRWTETTSRRVEAGGTSFVVETVRDISERHKGALLLQRQALTDPLTGVANRIVLMDRLRQALRRRDRRKGVLAVLLLDLDRFKVINDSLGHHIGDRVLRAMAERLLRFLHGSNTLAHLGCDEFVILAEDVVNEQAAVELGRRITQAGREPFRVGDEELVAPSACT